MTLNRFRGQGAPPRTVSHMTIKKVMYVLRTSNGVWLAAPWTASGAPEARAGRRLQVLLEVAGVENL